MSMILTLIQTLLKENDYIKQVIIDTNCELYTNTIMDIHAHMRMQNCSYYQMMLYLKAIEMYIKDRKELIIDETENTRKIEEIYVLLLKLLVNDYGSLNDIREEDKLVILVEFINNNIRYVNKMTNNIVYKFIKEETTEDSPLMVEKKVDKVEIDKIENKKEFINSLERIFIEPLVRYMRDNNIKEEDTTNDDDTDDE